MDASKWNLAFKSLSFTGGSLRTRLRKSNNLILKGRLERQLGTLKGEFGELPIEIPRNGHGTFEPQLIPNQALLR